MNGILKRGMVFGLIAMFGFTACSEKKKDNNGLLLAALLLGQQAPTWSITMTARVQTAAGANMASATDNRAVEFAQGSTGTLVLTSGEKIQYLATSGAQAGAGIVQVAFKTSTAVTAINVTTTSLKTGGNADLISDYTTASGSGNFTLTTNDADPTSLSQLSTTTVDLTQNRLVITAIRVVKSGSYNLENPTVAENICDGRSVVGSPTIKSGNITANETWTGAILLQGTINITGATVTVSPGTVVFGQRGSSLFAYNGGAIQAIGTATLPICFTSANAPGSRQPGDWGGIVLVGNGFNTRNSAAQTEGTTPQTYPSTTANSNSRFEYTVIEFAGNEVAPGDELNNLSMYSVDNSGTGPALNRVQVHRGLDDGFEWWGGNISGQYLVATGGLDDDFDADEGYGVNSSGASTATLTNLISLKYPASCGGSFSTDPSSFEMDGVNSGSGRQTCVATNSTNPTTSNCQTNPTVKNFTIIGVKASGGFGMQIREGMRGTFENGLIYGFNNAAVSCIRNGSFPNSLATFTNVVYGDSAVPVNTDSTSCVISAISNSLSATPITSLGNVSGDGCGFGATKPDFSTTSASPNKGAQAGDNTAWWQNWTVYRAR